MWRVLTTFGTSALVLAIGLINSVIVARSLGPGGRGQTAAAILWPMILTYMAGFGLNEATSYFGAKRLKSPGTVAATGVLSATILSTVPIAAAYGVMPVLLRQHTTDVVDWSRFLLVIIPVAFVSQHLTAILRAHGHIDWFNLCQLVNPATNLAATCLLLARGRLGVDGVLWSILAANIAGTASTMVAVVVTRSWSKPSIDWRLTRDMLAFGMRAHLGVLSSAVAVRLDQGLLAAFATSQDLGCYAVALSASSLSSVMAHVTSTLTAPAVARADQDAGRAILTAGFRQYLLVSSAAKLGLGLVLPFAIPLVFGPSFARAIIAAQILVVSSVFLDARRVLSAGANALNCPWSASEAELVGCVLVCVTVPAFLYAGGLAGAAAGVGVAHAGSLAFLLLRLRRKAGLAIRGMFRLDIAARELICSVTLGMRTCRERVR